MITTPVMDFILPSYINGKKVPIIRTIDMVRLVPIPTPAILHARPKKKEPIPQRNKNMTRSTIDAVVACPRTKSTLLGPPAQSRHTVALMIVE
jgi:hypothetical protein